MQLPSTGQCPLRREAAMTQMHYLYISIEEHEAKVKALETTIKEQEHLLQLGAVELRKLAGALDTIDQQAITINELKERLGIK
jgi:hypothetical protein